MRKIGKFTIELVGRVRCKETLESYEKVAITSNGVTKIAYIRRGAEFCMIPLDTESDIQELWDICVQAAPHAPQVWKYSQEYKKAVEK